MLDKHSITAAIKREKGLKMGNSNRECELYPLAIVWEGGE